MITEHWTQNTCVGLIKENTLAFNTFNSNYFNDFVIPNQATIMNNQNLSNNNLRMRRLKTRTKSELISKIRSLAKINKKYLNYSYLRSIKRYDLLFDAVKHFGGWRIAIESAGFRPIQKGWNKKEIIHEIINVHNMLNKVPTRQEIKELNIEGLTKAAERHFTSWNNAIIAADLKPNKITNWTKQKAINELLLFARKLGRSPSMRELKESNQYNLLNAGLKFFGKYNIFLNAANLSPVLEMNKWPKAKIIEELKKIYSEFGRTPRRNELAAMKRFDLINAAETYFPSWSDALIAAGLVSNSDVLNDDLTWREWENLIFEYLAHIKLDFQKKKYIRNIGYPDIYIPSKNKIIEIKLNCSDNSVKKDIQKYLPCCNSLEIWYLYGKPFGIMSNKVKFVGPNTIKNKLSEFSTLLKKFNEIKKKSEEKRVKQKIKKIILLGSGAN